MRFRGKRYTPSISAKREASNDFICFRCDSCRFVCPACLKPFKHQKVIAIKACGHVMCADCFKKFVGTSKQCFVCQSPVVKKKDFIQMEAGGTSFSSHNKIAVKVYTPTEN